MTDKQQLDGGREGQIFKQGEFVIRPVNPWTVHVHNFLNFLHDKNINFVPKPISLNDQNEIVSFKQGEVFNYPLPDFFLSDAMLINASTLLRKFHDAGQSYIEKLSNNEQWMIPAKKPFEVMCHGDFAPYNVTIQNQQIVAMIDFDTVHPAPKMWDIAYAVYRFVPFMNPNNPDCYHSLNEQIKRANVFLDAYGLSEQEKKTFPDYIIERLQSLVDYMQVQANNGNQDFAQNIADGHLDGYLEDIEYFKQHQEKIIKNLV